MISAEPVQRLARFYTCYGLAVDPNGKDYTAYVDEVYNRKQGTTGVTLSGFRGKTDPVWNVEKAKASFKSAHDALIAAGTLTEKDFPIKVDVLGDQDPETFAYEKAMYAEMEKECKQYVKIQYNVPKSDDQNSEWGSVINNYDFSMWSGWGPDYGDPNTFLHTMCVGGDMVEQLCF